MKKCSSCKAEIVGCRVVCPDPRRRPVYYCTKPGCVRNAQRRAALAFPKLSGRPRAQRPVS